MAEDKVKQRVLERLSDAQKNKEFKDTSHDINYTKKYKRSFDVVTANNLEEIESDPINAYKQVVKDKVWAEYNVQEQKEKGYSSGATYFKVELRKSLSSRPFDSKDARDVYVKNIGILISILDGCFTAEQCQKAVKDFIYNKEFYVGDVSDLESDKWTYSRKLTKKLESIFSVRFMNFCKRGSDASATTWYESLLFDPYSKEEQDAYILKQIETTTERLAQAKLNLEQANNKSNDEIERQVRSKYGSLFKNRQAFDEKVMSDFPEIKKLYLNGYERNVKQIETDLISLNNREGLRDIFVVRDNNWDWSTEVKEQVQRTENKAPKINTKLPLSYINRVGGYEIPDVSVESIANKFCFNNVVFGNALKDIESREHVRHFLGALTDLADILDIDICKVNQLGKLDINFATMGVAGHMATYFPSYKAINLSKNNGDGSVAHEWLHYVDNCIAEGDNRKATNRFASEDGMTSKNPLYYAIEALKKYISKGDGDNKTIIKKFPAQTKVRYHAYSDTLEGCIAEIQQRYRIYGKASESKNKSVINYYGYLATKFGKEYIEVPMVLDTTQFYFNSSKIGTSYWIQPAELFARSFEAYIEYKLDKLDRKNNYLVSYKNNYEFSILGTEGMPYPQGEELEKIAVLYDNIFAEFKKEYNIGSFVPFTNKRTSEYVDIKIKESKKEKNTNQLKNTDMPIMSREPQNVENENKEIINLQEDSNLENESSYVVGQKIKYHVPLLRGETSVGKISKITYVSKGNNKYYVDTFYNNKNQVHFISEEDIIEAIEDIKEFGGFYVGQIVHTNLDDNTYEILEFNDTEKQLGAKVLLKPIEMIIGGEKYSGDIYNNLEVGIQDLRFETIKEEGQPIQKYYTEDDVTLAKTNINLAVDTYIKDKNRINGNRVGELLYSFFRDYVTEYPKEFSFLLETNKKLVDAYKFKLTFEVDYNESFWNEFRESLKANNLTIWDVIPEEYKVIKKQPKLNFEPTHTDANLIDITKGFVGNDGLRPILTGVNFDDFGICATDSHKMIFIPTETNEKGVYCVSKECFKNSYNEDAKIEGYKFPAYQSVIPKLNQWLDVDLESLYLYTNTLIKTDLVNRGSELTIFKYGEEKIAFKAEILLECVNAMRKLGNKKCSLGFSSPSRPVLFVKQGLEDNFTISNLKTQFCLLMPMVLNGTEKYPDFYYDFSTESFVQNDISVSLNIEEIKINQIKKEVEQKIDVNQEKFAEQSAEIERLRKEKEDADLYASILKEREKRRSLIPHSEHLAVYKKYTDIVDAQTDVNLLNGEYNSIIMQSDFTDMPMNMQNDFDLYVEAKEYELNNPIVEVVKHKPTIEELEDRIDTIKSMIKKGKGDAEELNDRIDTIGLMIKKLKKQEQKN